MTASRLTEDNESEQQFLGSFAPRLPFFNSFRILLLISCVCLARVCTLLSSLRPTSQNKFDRNVKMASSSRTASKRSPNRRMTQLADEREYLLDIIFALAQVVPRPAFKQSIRSHELTATTMAHLKLERFAPPSSTNRTSEILDGAKSTAALLSKQEYRNDDQVEEYHASRQPAPRPSSRSTTPTNVSSRRERAVAPLPKSLYDDPEPPQLSDCDRALQMLRSARELEKKSIDAFPTSTLLPGSSGTPVTSVVTTLPNYQQVAPFQQSQFGMSQTPPPHFYPPPPPAPMMAFAPPLQSGYDVSRPNVHDSVPDDRRNGVFNTPRSSSNPWEVFRTGP